MKTSRAIEAFQVRNRSSLELPAELQNARYTVGSQQGKSQRHSQRFRCTESGRHGATLEKARNSAESLQGILNEIAHSGVSLTVSFNEEMMARLECVDQEF